MLQKKKVLKLNMLKLPHIISNMTGVRQLTYNKKKAFTVLPISLQVSFNTVLNT